MWGDIGSEEHCSLPAHFVELPSARDLGLVLPSPPPPFSPHRSNIHKYLFFEL